MEEIIKQDINKIIKSLELGQNNSATNRIAEDLQEELLTRYKSEIPHIDSDLSYYLPDLNGHGHDIYPDYISNLKKIKVRLEMFLVKIKEDKPIKKEEQSSGQTLNIYATSSSDNHSTNSSDNNNTLSNTNNNTVDVKLLFEDARNKIEENASLGEEELQEILGKINELEELHDSDDKPRSKWNKSKEVMTWVLTKGAKVASIVLPLITEVIKQ